MKLAIKEAKSIYKRYQPIAKKLLNALIKTVESGNPSKEERFIIRDHARTIIEAVAKLRDLAAYDFLNEGLAASDNLHNCAFTIRETLPALFDDLGAVLGITLKPSSFRSR